MQTFQADLTFEGPLLASDKLLLCPQGRVPPLVFDRRSGKKIGSLDKKSGGGSFVLMTDDEQIYHGPGNKGGWVTASSASNRAKLATLPDANAMVVAGDRAYVLTDLNLSAIDRNSQKPIWSIPAVHPFELILAGETIFAGGDRELAAYETATGECVWTTPIDGRAYGIAVADGSLLVSTNHGSIHCFRADVATSVPMDWADGHALWDTRSTAAASGLQEVEAISRGAKAPTTLNSLESRASPEDGGGGLDAGSDEPGLTSRWAFSSGTATPRPGLPPDVVNLAGGTVRDLTGDRDATVLGNARIVRAGGVDAIALGGTSNSVLVTGDLGKADLPAKQFTASAWVRIDSTVPWGGIVGAIQDNGDFERGWILGYRIRRGVSSKYLASIYRLFHRFFKNTLGVIIKVQTQNRVHNLKSVP